MLGKINCYLARLSILLITVALIAVMVGCIGGPPEGGPYDLTINSTAGGSVTTPGEGTFTYNGGECVELVAEAEEGYRFVEWTGDVYEIENDAITIICFQGDGDYSITANFGVNSTPMVAAGGYHTGGLRSDRTAIAMGKNYYGQCAVVWMLN